MTTQLKVPSFANVPDKFDKSLELLVESDFKNYQLTRYRVELAASKRTKKRGVLSREEKKTLDVDKEKYTSSRDTFLRNDNNDKEAQFYVNQLDEKLEDWISSCKEVWQRSSADTVTAYQRKKASLVEVLQKLVAVRPSWSIGASKFLAKLYYEGNLDKDLKPTAAEAKFEELKAANRLPIYVSKHRFDIFHRNYMKQRKTWEDLPVAKRTTRSAAAKKKPASMKKATAVKDTPISIYVPKKTRRVTIKSKDIPISISLPKTPRAAKSSKRGSVAPSGLHPHDADLKTKEIGEKPAAIDSTDSLSPTDRRDQQEAAERVHGEEQRTPVQKDSTEPEPESDPEEEDGQRPVQKDSTKPESIAPTDRAHGEDSTEPESTAPNDRVHGEDDGQHLTEPGPESLAPTQQYLTEPDSESLTPTDRHDQVQSSGSTLKVFFAKEAEGSDDRPRMDTSPPPESTPATFRIDHTTFNPPPEEKEQEQRAQEESAEEESISLEDIDEANLVTWKAELDAHQQRQMDIQEVEDLDQDEDDAYDEMTQLYVQAAEVKKMKIKAKRERKQRILNRDATRSQHIQSLHNIQSQMNDVKTPMKQRKRYAGLLNSHNEAMTGKKGPRPQSSSQIGTPKQLYTDQE